MIEIKVQTLAAQIAKEAKAERQQRKRQRQLKKRLNTQPTNLVTI